MGAGEEEAGEKEAFLAGTLAACCGAFPLAGRWMGPHSNCGVFVGIEFQTAGASRAVTQTGAREGPDLNRLACRGALPTVIQLR
jgi:hypothetical protein